MDGEVPGVRRWIPSPTARPATVRALGLRDVAKSAASSTRMLSKPVVPISAAVRSSSADASRKNDDTHRHPPALDHRDRPPRPCFAPVHEKGRRRSRLSQQALWPDVAPDADCSKSTTRIDHRPHVPCQRAADECLTGTSPPSTRKRGCERSIRNTATCCSVARSRVCTASSTSPAGGTKQLSQVDTEHDT